MRKVLTTNKKFERMYVKMKKLFALLVSVLLIATILVPAAAADTHELFITNAAPGHTYDAYQLFGGDLSTDGSVLYNIVWGSSIVGTDYNYAEDLITALTTDVKEIAIINGTTTLKDVFVRLTTDTVTAMTTEKKAAVLAEIMGTISNDSNILDRFAEVVGEVVYNAEGKFESHKYLGEAVANSTPAADGTGYELKDLPAGYYLIKDRDNTVAGAGDFYTKYIVRVVKSDTITVKGEGVSVDKTVNDTINGTYTEFEDASTNETLYYKWVGTLPNNLASYDSYSYKFVDTMSKGLKFIQFESIYVENANGTVAHVFMDLNDENPDNDQLPEGITVTGINDADGIKDNQVFTLEFADLFESYPTILPNQKVVVKYSTIVTRDALTAEAMTNKVEVEYSNNPNGQGTGTTVPDVAHAFTFEIDIDKYDAANQTIKLEGVEFVLYYQDADADGNVIKHYAQVITEEMVAAGESVNGRPVTDQDVGTVYGFSTNREDASVLDTDADGKIDLFGLDAGIYYLEETKTNDGYNLLDTPVQIEIKPTYTVTGDECAVTVEYEVDGRSQGASNVVGVRNSKGSTLPSTGGIGTTLFYVIGGALVLAAIVLLITKKRMSAEH